MFSLLDNATIELELLLERHPDPDNRPIVERYIPEILKIIEKFGASGQSGASAPLTASVLTRTLHDLLLYKPINPITGDDDEWDVVEFIRSDQIIFQNKRCSGLFKTDKNNDSAYYIDAIMWKTPTNTWSGSAYLSNGQKIKGKCLVKSFPFNPKTFYIDVIEEEITPANWKFYIKNENDLDEVFEYYNP